MLHDIDYAARAVKAAIVEKFGRSEKLDALEVVANERTLSVLDGERLAEGTRDNLLAMIRKSDSYKNLWQTLMVSGEQLISSLPNRVN
jgi:hypothetical protein